MGWIPLFSLLLALVHINLVSGLTTFQLRERSIYQVITDRFATPDGRNDRYCDPAERAYCGGGWKGIEYHLEYIQGMGFDTGELGSGGVVRSGITPEN
jgi:alpha-amylase